MEALKHNLKQRLQNLILCWPIFAAYILTCFLAKPLHRYIGIPIWITTSAAFLILISHSVFYWHKGAEDRHKIAEDKKAFAEKVAAAEMQLFGTNQH